MKGQSSIEAHRRLVNDLEGAADELRTQHAVLRSCAVHIARVPSVLALPVCALLIVLAVVLRLATARVDLLDLLDVLCVTVIAALFMANCALGALHRHRQAARTAERLAIHLRPFVAALATVEAEVAGGVYRAVQDGCIPHGVVGVPVLRDGVWRQLPPSLLVRGDVVALLSPGDVRELFGSEWANGKALAEVLPWGDGDGGGGDADAAAPVRGADAGVGAPSAFGASAGAAGDAAHLRALGATKHVLLRTPACVRLQHQVHAPRRTSVVARAARLWRSRWVIGSAVLGFALCLAAGAARCAVAGASAVSADAALWDIDPWREVLLRPAAVVLALLSPALPLLLGAWRACALARLLRAMRRAEGTANLDMPRGCGGCCVGDCLSAAPALGASALLPAPSFVDALGSITFMCCADSGVLCAPVPIVEEVCVVEGDRAEELVILDLHSAVFAQLLRDGVAAGTGRNRSGANAVEFEDPHWREHIASLKPVGLASLLHAQPRTRGAAAPALAACMSELAHAIGFVASDSKSFSAKRSVALREANCTIFEDVRFKKQLRRKLRRDQRRKRGGSVAVIDVPGDAAILDAALADAADAEEGGGGGDLSPLALFAGGDAEFVLQRCWHVWTGSQPLPLAEKVAKELLSYCAQLRREDHSAIAFAYAPLTGGAESFDFESISGLTLLGLIAYRGVPRNGVQTLISESMRSGIRFAYFSPRRYRECRPLAAKMGLNTGWNCAISLNKRDEAQRAGGGGDEVNAEGKEAPAASRVERPASVAALDEVIYGWVYPDAGRGAGAADGEENVSDVANGDAASPSSSAASPSSSATSPSSSAQHALVIAFASTSDEATEVDGEARASFEALAMEFKDSVHFVAITTDSDCAFALAFEAEQTPSYYFYTLEQQQQDDGAASGGAVDGAAAAARVKRVCLTSFVGHNASRLRSNSDALRTMCAGPAPALADEDDGAAGAVPWMEHSRLPECVEEIRDHITNVDNVPLLVSLFTNVSPQPTREMVAIMQENDEVVCVVASARSATEQMGSRRFAVNSESAGRRAVVDIGHCLAIDQADVAIARAGAANIAESARDAAGGAPARLAAAAGTLSARLNTLTCAVEIQHSSHPRLLVDLAREARQISLNVQQALALAVVSQMAVGLLLVLCALLALPPPLTISDVLWLLCVQVPILATSHIVVPPRAGLAELMPVKRSGSDARTTIESLLWGALRIVPIVIALLVLWVFALTQAVLPSTDSDASASAAGLSLSRATADLMGVWGASTAANRGARDALRSSATLAAPRSYMLCAFVLIAIALSVGGLGGQRRTQSALRSLPHRSAAWVRAVALVVALQLAHWFARAVLHSLAAGVALRTTLVGEAPHAWWGYGVVALAALPTAIVGSEELHKLRERKSERLAQMQRRQTFDCRLGLWSPV